MIARSCPTTPLSSCRQVVIPSLHLSRFQGPRNVLQRRCSQHMWAILGRAKATGSPSAHPTHQTPRSLAVFPLSTTSRRRSLQKALGQARNPHSKQRGASGMGATRSWATIRALGSATTFGIITLGTSRSLQRPSWRASGAGAVGEERCSGKTSQSTLWSATRRQRPASANCMGYVRSQ